LQEEPVARTWVEESLVESVSEDDVRDVAGLLEIDIRHHARLKYRSLPPTN